MTDTEILERQLEEARLAMCEGKQRHATRGGAQDQIAFLQRRDRRRGHKGSSSSRLNSYRCDACGDWHIGRKGGR